jgi:hypothetical protein
MRCFVLLGIFGVLTLSGCGGFSDANLVVRTDGPIAVSKPSSLVLVKSLDNNLIGDFTTAYNVSACYSHKYVGGECNNVPSGTADAEKAALRMARIGFSLADSYCQQFFRSEGDNQTYLNVASDAWTILGTAATGAVGLATKSGTAAGALGLVTAAGKSGIDLYAKNFLFGADNIDAVRTLVLDALGQDTKANIPVTDDKYQGWRFEYAMSKIQDHQMICQPARIRDLSVQAIKAGTVVAYNSATNQPTKADETVKPNERTTLNVVKAPR